FTFYSTDSLNHTSFKTASETLKCQLSTFLQEIRATVLPTSNVSIDAVFDQYFGKRPPFGEGKKKSEFPDAFAIEAIEAWCKENDERMYVISADGDLKEYCETSDCLIALDKLPKFISVIEESHDEGLAHSVSELLNKNQDAIKGAITESFCKQDFWIEGHDGDVNEVRVNELEISEILILEVEQDVAFVHVDVETNFSADLTYDDSYTAAYDREETVWPFLVTIDKTVDQDVEYTATIQVLHDVENLKYFEVDWVEIQPKQMTGSELRVGFAVRIDNKWPYE
ncbi:MAG: PIN domain-containing protein, partial [Gemmatimonadetes bacterium]|nr:PIN domain-containing protein [Gemmatimonadota bacterium]